MYDLKVRVVIIINFLKRLNNLACILLLKQRYINFFYNSVMKGLRVAAVNDVTANKSIG